MAVDVQRVLVVGAGTMGTGIAQVAARAGYRTEIFDVAAGTAPGAGGPLPGFSPMRHLCT